MPRYIFRHSRTTPCSTPMPPYPSKHHCKCGKSTKRAAALGYCPKCSTRCDGQGTARTKSGQVVNITHRAWVHYQSESCSACREAKAAIEKRPECISHLSTRCVLRPHTPKKSSHICRLGIRRQLYERKRCAGVERSSSDRLLSA